VSRLAHTIRRRPVASFVVIAFAISYVIGIPFNLAVSATLHLSQFWAVYLPRLVTVLGPAVAAIIVARIGAGPISRSQLVRSLSIGRRYIGWVPVVLIVGLAVAVTAFRLAGTPTVELLRLLRGAILALGAHLVINAMIIGVGEELGWRGWLLRSLATERTFASATALTALAWTVWHLPVFLSGMRVALSLLSLLIALSVVFAWLWLRTEGSVGVVAIAHASVNAPFFVLESEMRERGDSFILTTTAFAYVAAIYLCVAILLAVGDRHVWLSSQIAPRA
jgi:membrane protease YdiL (CAAX protease family)